MSPAPAGPYPPTNDLVVVAWLRGITGIDAGQVATTLPKPAEDGTLSWADSGFLQAQVIPGGRPSVDGLGRHPVAQLDAWAATPGSIKPPWNLAARLLELVRLATEDGQLGRYGKPVTLPTGYSGARVLAAYLISEPARVTDDPSGYARFTADLVVDWAPA